MAEALATISEVTGLGMIQIRADLTVSGAAIAAAAGVDLPRQARIVQQGGRALGWMSPDELLLVLPATEVAAMMASLEGALAGSHALVVDVSDMRAVFDVAGGRAGQVLAKLSPTDFAALPEDGLRRTRLGQVACGIWAVAGGYRVIGFRSVADYIRGVLVSAAKPGSQLDPR